MKSGKPSSTARLIVEGLLLLSHDFRFAHLIDPRTTEWNTIFAKAWGRGRLFFSLIQWSWLRNCLFWLEGLVIPGMILHYAVRKKYIEETCRSKIKDGVQQVVILGAGFDTLALRLSTDFPNVQWIEIDHPATQALKNEALKGIIKNQNFKMVGVDLMKSELPGVSTDLPTFLIIEGVTMYLSESKICSILQWMKKNELASSGVLFSFMKKLDTGRIGFEGATSVSNLWLSLKNEPFTWGIEPDRLDGFLAQRGFDVIEKMDENLFHQKYLLGTVGQSGKLAVGEHFCLSKSHQKKN